MTSQFTLEQTEIALKALIVIIIVAVLYVTKKRY